MFFSKSAITLLSSIGASSIPVVSVIALYKIKHFSLGNNLESSSTASSSEENVISLPEAKQPEPAKPASPEPASPPEAPKAEQAQQKPPAQKEQKNTSEESPKKSKDKTKPPTPTQKPSTPSAPVITKNTITNDPEDPKIVVVNEPINPQDLHDLAKAILDGFTNGQKQATDDSNIVKNIDNLSAFLEKKSLSIDDDSEKEKIKEIIESLNKLKSKISTKK